MAFALIKHSFLSLFRTFGATLSKCTDFEQDKLSHPISRTPSDSPTQTTKLQKLFEQPSEELKYFAYYLEKIMSR